MWRLTIGLALAGLLFNPSNVQAQTIEIVATTLAKAQYCRGDAEMFTVLLDIRLTVRNTSDRNLILPKHLSSPAARISQDLAAAKRGEYDYEIEYTEITRDHRDATSIPCRPSSKKFVILKPDHTAIVETQHAVLAGYSGVKALPRTVEAGSDLAVSLLVVPWPSLSDPERLREAWNHVGDLVTTPIWTDPVYLTVPSKPHTKDCDQ